MTLPTLPAWFPRNGRPLHLVVGTAVTLFNVLLVLIVALLAPPSAAVSLWFVGALLNGVAVLALALAHEQAPRDNGVTWYDFRAHFWNGGFDVLCFLPAATLWLLVGLAV